MHEFSIMNNLMNQIRELANHEGGGRIVGVKVRFGALSGMSSEHFREHFIAIADHSIGSGVVLHMESSQDIYDPNATAIVLDGIEIETN
ncbi:MAG: hydrogenase/urease maturation nickel metallochaperone HypA [Proteobacteria bacterium]|nr:hydrogenase/urease maturation nickel metallochaperone HypA [Pseudomonadota bacterium]